VIALVEHSDVGAGQRGGELRDGVRAQRVDAGCGVDDDEHACAVVEGGELDAGCRDFGRAAGEGGDEHPSRYGDGGAEGGAADDVGEPVCAGVEAGVGDGGGERGDGGAGAGGFEGDAGGEGGGGCGVSGGEGCGGGELLEAPRHGDVFEEG